jgi:NAD(P)-dependent dehydrogenase (short-subunit alcohol dehydrogenase family)
MTFNQLENLNGKTVVIAGGCGQVGFESAKQLAKHGAKIIALVRRELETAQSMMDTLGNGSYAILASITDTNSIKLAANEIKLKEGKCDILINAAGVTRSVPPTQDLSDELFDEIVDTNLKGVYITIREFKKLLSVSGDSLIINMSSVAGSRASQSNLAYGAAKAGVDLITKTLAKALAPSIRIVGIAPSFLENPTSGATKPPGANERIALNSPLQRVGNASDIASTIVCIAMNLRFITGQTITVDGGFTL